MGSSQSRKVRKMCQVKYDALGIPFPFAHLPEPTAEKMAALNALLQPIP